MVVGDHYWGQGLIGTDTSVASAGLKANQSLSREVLWELVKSCNAPKQRANMATGAERQLSSELKYVWDSAPWLVSCDNLSAVCIVCLKLTLQLVLPSTFGDIKGNCAVAPLWRNQGNWLCAEAHHFKIINRFKCYTGVAMFKTLPTLVSSEKYLCSFLELHG